jgi:hypothetical protein
LKKNSLLKLLSSVESTDAMLSVMKSTVSRPSQMKATAVLPNFTQREQSSAAEFQNGWVLVDGDLDF